MPWAGVALVIGAEWRSSPYVQGILAFLVVAGWTRLGLLLRVVGSQNPPMAAHLMGSDQLGGRGGLMPYFSITNRQYSGTASEAGRSMQSFRPVLERCSMRT